jgi:hypothetical protein
VAALPRQVQVDVELVDVSVGSDSLAGAPIVHEFFSEIGAPVLFAPPFAVLYAPDAEHCALTGAPQETVNEGLLGSLPVQFQLHAKGWPLAAGPPETVGAVVV